MSKKRTEDIAREIATGILDQLGYELVDIEFKKEGAHWYLRVYIDKPNGITLDDCQKASKMIGEVLDKQDPIPHNYYLEVSSPGLDRPLKRDKDFIRYKGHNVDISLYKAIDGSKSYTGQLIGMVDNVIEIKIGDKDLQFKREDVAIVRLAIEF
ncbi:MAG TPA: ribosome maturation factor RimP [Clostridia bacterium]|nr:ribosome maturation factor RimP [Clostridia bacterium]